jgi:peptidoglycan/LPS O-acetylase OafA/YrhL
LQNQTFPRLPQDASRVLGLDLLRAGAVLMVLTSHWAAHMGAWFGLRVPAAFDTLGDIGVELFFALSGFLIGRILIGVAETRPGWRDYAVFMARRGMRTLPLYFCWLGLLLLVFPPADLAGTAWRYATLTQNLLTPFPADYYFAVTWSLVVEEWFYLLFGGALLALSCRMGGRRALWCCLAVFLVAPLVLRLAYQERGAVVFFRIDEIGYGVLMARLHVDGSRLFRHAWALLAAGLVMLGAVLADCLPVPGWLAVSLTSNVEVIGSALCLPAALRLSRAAGWFARPVRWVAGRSYALYLIHLTILVDVVEMRLVTPGVLPLVACVAVAVLLPLPLAELSWRLLERPMLRLRPHQRRGMASRVPHPARQLAGFARVRL